MKILFLPLIITIWAWVLKHHADKPNPSDKRSVRLYLNRESAANSVRKQDISNLPYIQPPTETLPLDITLKDEKKQFRIANYKKEILSYSDKPMLNLIGVTNTELKEQYGPANLDALSAYDYNYGQYMRNLYLFAQDIYDEYPEEAVRILTYCVETGTDISAIYQLLGSHYIQQQEFTKFQNLYQFIPDTTSISGKMILNKLDRLNPSQL